jgi:carbonic anhydrase
MKVVEVTYRYEAQATPARPRPGNPDAARMRLNDGNRAFAALLDDLSNDGRIAQRVVPVDAGDLGLSQGARRAPHQMPFAAILGCSDARVPVELIFNEGPNDLFVVRVAGNGLAPEVLGSLTYAIEHLGKSLKLVAVLGHSGCGAVSAAVDVFLKPSKFFPLAGKYALRSILDPLLVVVQACAQKLQQIFGSEVAERSGYREALIESAIITNAALAAYTVQREITAAGLDGLRAAYGVYLLTTGQIWAPQGDGSGWTGLADPPADDTGFVAFGVAVAKSDRIKGMLGLG